MTLRATAPSFLAYSGLASARPGGEQRRSTRREEESMGHGTQTRVSRLALLVVGLAAGPSAPAGEWIRLYGTAEWERVGSMASTSDGGYVLAGWSSTAAVSLISKVDAEGLPQWQRSFGGITDPTRVLQAQDGSLVVVGGARTGTRYDAALIRMDANGALTGQVRLGDASSDAFTDVLERQRPLPGRRRERASRERGRRAMGRRARPLRRHIACCGVAAHLRHGGQRAGPPWPHPSDRRRACPRRRLCPLRHCDLLLLR